MPVLKILMNAEGMNKELDPEKIIHLKTPITVGALEGGMESGKPSIAFMFDLPDGRTVIAETSLQLFVTAARAFTAKFGDQLEP
jgi:hypothetical protein